jgi:hypothetical protein
MAFRLLPVVALVAISIVLAGCSVQEPPTEVTPSVAPVDTSGWESISLSGTAGATETNFDVPAGAKSIDLTVACAGGTIVFVSADPEFTNTMTAACGSVSTQRLDLSGRLNLVVNSPDGADYSLTGVYSIEEADEPDPLIESDCNEYSELNSAVWNAEDGFRLGANSLDQWKAEVAAAGVLASEFDADGSELIDLQLPTFVSVLARPELTPGELVDFSGASTVIGEFRSAQNIVQQVCNRNGTELFINANYMG